MSVTTMFRDVRTVSSIMFGRTRVVDRSGNRVRKGSFVMLRAGGIYRALPGDVDVAGIYQVNRMVEDDDSVEITVTSVPVDDSTTPITGVVRADNVLGYSKFQCARISVVTRVDNALDYRSCLIRPGGLVVTRDHRNGTRVAAVGGIWDAGEARDSVNGTVPVLQLSGRVGQDSLVGSTSVKAVGSVKTGDPQAGDVGLFWGDGAGTVFMAPVVVGAHSPLTPGKVLVKSYDQGVDDPVYDEAAPEDIVVTERMEW